MNFPSLPQRQTAAETLAACLVRLFPGAQIHRAEATQEGFVCDCFLPQPLGQEAVSLIEEHLRRFIKEDHPIKQLEMMRENACQLLQHHGQMALAEALRHHPDKIVPIIQIGDYYASPKNPVQDSTKEAGTIKILSITGGTELTRIFGTTQANPQILKKFLKAYEAHRDHQQLGREMQLFVSLPQFPGEFCWLPKGMIFFEILYDWWKKALQEYGFELISAPSSSALLQAQNPQIFPIYWAQTAKKGELSSSPYGLLEASPRTVDNLQIVCTPDQVSKELISSLQFFDKSLNIFGFESQWNLRGKRVPKAAGTRAQWEQSVRWLVGALEARGYSPSVDEKDATVDGPCLELHIRDALGREWPLAYVCVDLSAKNLPVVLSLSLLHSFERLTALILEQTGGKLPLWLAPEQVRVIPMAVRHGVYASEVAATLAAKGLRVVVDASEEKLGSKVHAAEKERVPYMVILGDKELKEGLISVRVAGEEGLKPIELKSLVEELFAKGSESFNEVKQIES